MQLLTVIMVMANISLGNVPDFPAGQSKGPLEIVDSQGIKIPVYDFEGFSPFLYSQNDTTYVINFWATWCKPCVEELPYFARLYRELSGQKVRFLFVSLDFRKNMESSLIPFIHSKGYPEPVIMLHDPDANSWIDKVDQSWSGAIPATLIYRKDRRQFFERSFNYEDLYKTVENFLNDNHEDN